MAQWLIWLGGEVIHQPVTTERNVIAAKLTLALDSAGSLEVDVPVTHPLYATVASLPILGPATWRVERDGTEVFRGRTLTRERRPLDGAVRVVAEGDLAMLNDTIRTPYEFAGSPSQYVRMLVDNHNAQTDPWKQFNVGTVDIVDKGGNDYIVRGSESTVGTLEELLAKTVNSSDAGHIVMRRGTHVIDWRAVVSEPCDQQVRLGWNLLGLEDVADGSELVTAIRAVGADVDGTRVTIASTRTGGAGVTVKDGILVNDALAATNGTVVREVVWDDVTTEAALWSRALAYAQGLSEPRSVTVSAIDMSDAGHAVDAFDVGQVVALDALDTTGTMQVTGIEWDLLDPAGGSITFGDVRVTSSARSAATTATADAALYVAGNSSGGTSDRPVTLFDDPSASASAAATLSETAANFSRLTIFFKDNDGNHSSADVWQPDGKRVALAITWISGASTQEMYQRVRWVTISGTSISTYKGKSDAKYRTGQVKLGATASVTNSDYISIVHVIGWR